MYIVVGYQKSCKDWRKFQIRIIFERYYSFFRYCLLSYRYVMLQKSILSKPKWGSEEVSGGTSPGPHPVATALPAPRGAFRGRAPPNHCLSPQARIVPQKKVTGQVPRECISGLVSRGAETREGMGGYIPQ